MITNVLNSQSLSMPDYLLNMVTEVKIDLTGIKNRKLQQ
jgi:hypothetical protein